MNATELRLDATEVARIYRDIQEGRRTTNSSAGGRKDDAPPASQWDLKRALKDALYNAEWKGKDPKGHAAAWEKHFAEIEAARPARR